MKWSLLAKRKVFQGLVCQESFTKRSMLFWDYQGNENVSSYLSFPVPALFGGRNMENIWA